MKTKKATDAYRYYEKKRKGRTRILLIDDEEAFTDMLKVNLELGGDYRVEVENDSLEAVKTARRCQPDLILLDAIMPGLDGFEVLTRLEEDPLTRRIPVVFLTAISHKINFPLFRMSEVVQRKTIGKPVKIGDLIEVIEHELDAGEFLA